MTGNVRLVCWLAAVFVITYAVAALLDRIDFGAPRSTT